MSNPFPPIPGEYDVDAHVRREHERDRERADRQEHYAQEDGWREIDRLIRRRPSSR
jgi:hypothetical protein